MNPIILAVLARCHAHAYIHYDVAVASINPSGTYGDVARPRSLQEQYGEDRHFEADFKACETLVPQIIAVAAKDDEARKAARESEARYKAAADQQHLKDAANILAGKPQREYPNCVSGEVVSVDMKTGKYLCSVMAP
jgi:hypothetical protein